jgi:hypothetical protein
MIAVRLLDTVKDSMKRVEANAEFEALYEKHEKEEDYSRSEALVHYQH